MSMKKLFTMIFALCISLGAWAQAVVSTDNGTTVITSTSTDVWINYGTAWQTLVENTKFKGDFSSFNWEDLAGKSYTRSLTDARFDYSEATGVQVSSINTLLTFNSLNSNISKLVLPANISIPTDISSLGVSDAIFKYVFVTNSSGVSSVYVTSKVTDASMLSYEFTASRIESITNNGINLTGDPDAMQVIHDYLVANNVPEEKITIPFVFRGNLDVTGGSVAQNISDAKAAHPEITDDAITSITVTSGTLSSDDLTRLGQLTNLETIILPNGTASFPDLSSLTNFKKVVYKDAKGNYNVLIPKRGSSLDVSVIGDYDVTGTNVTITGELNATDLASINGIANASLLNLSDITIASGSSITSLVANGNAAIVLPNSITNAELGTLQHVGGDNPTYKCLAYLEDAAYQSSGNDHKVCVYTTQCSSLLNLSSFVNTNSSLVFQPLYKTDGTLENYMLQYNNEIQNLLTYAKELPVLNIDFGMVYVGLSTDFSQLNSATHYITIPVNGAYDFTNETDAYDNDGNKYVYGDNIYVVATYKNPEGIYAKTCMYAGKSFTATEPTNITYVRQAGTLSGASGTVSQEMMTATRQIFVGNLIASDVSAMHMMGATTFDFVDATVADNDIQAFANDNVKYLALPYNANDAIAATSPNTCTFSTTCPALLCVGALNPTSKTFTAWTRQNLDANNVQIPSLYVVTGIINQNTSIENLTLSGYYCRRDVKVLSAVTDNSGLIGATIKTADLKNAVFAPNSEMVLSMAHNDTSHPGASWGSITSILLPTSSAMTDIPDYCLNNAQGLTSVCIPYNIQNIGAFSFALTYINTVTTTDAAGEEIGYGNKTLTFSSNLKSIKEGAFQTQDETISDVYVLATTAPKCEANAFSAGGLYGWGGFGGNNTHPMCREVYWNGDAHQFTMLHFPSDVTLDEAKKYTDVTRDYTLWDETGDYNGIGELRVWPNFSEIYRAYNQAVDGVTWDAWDLTRSKANLNDIPCWPTSYKDASGATVNVENTYYAGFLIPASTTPATSDEANGYVYDTDYMGWHQFVLADYHRYKEIVIEEASTYTDGGWYTLCIPFDMTEDEVIRVMGVPASATYTGKGYEIASGKNAGCNLPIVYSLQKVTRQNPNIKLGFSQELMKQIELNSKNLVFNNDGTITLGADTYNNGKTSGSGEKVLIKGGYPYLVRPIFPEGFNEAANVNGNLGKYILSVCSFTDDQIGNKKEGTEIAAPIISQKLIAVNQAGAQVTYEEDGKPYYYFFQGTYTPQRMPQAYYINNGSWWRQTTAGVRDWESFTAIIGGHTSVDGATYATASGANVEATNKKDFSTWFVMLNAYSDKFTTPGHNDVKFEITFEDEDGFDEVVAIDQINGESINSSIEGDVYNMAGQRVGTSVEGLSKGLYIVNGKKVLVK